jgi:UDP-N-acetylmuramoylalanine--D-glutamate ligase
VVVRPDLSGRRVLVVGLGVSGEAAAAVLTARGADVVTLDETAPGADVRDVTAVEPGGFDLLVASPGWSPQHPVLAGAVAAGVPVWSEVELAWQLRADRSARSAGRAVSGPAPWLAVTGTNGKTTTVGMLSSILTVAGEVGPAVGNVGTPVVTAATDPAVDVLAVELSSFQMHFTTSLAAQAAVVLNVAPDHLDWHGGIDAYAAAKAKVYAGVTAACVYDVAQPQVEAMVRAADVVDGARAVGITGGPPGAGQIGVVEGIIVDRAFHAPFDDPGRSRSAVELADLGDLAHLAGPTGVVAPHVVSNALAASALARAHGVEAAAVRDGLRAFPAGAHRSVVVRTLDGVGYVDDSKATNAHAAAASLAGFAPGAVVWIAGGLAKGARFDDLVAARADRLRAVVLIGVDPEPMADALGRHAPGIPVARVDPTDTGTVMTRAVAQARRLARPGDTVLLAPACASMDQFASYAARGDAYAQAVLELDPTAKTR